MLPRCFPLCSCHGCGLPLSWDGERNSAFAPFYWSRGGGVLCRLCFGDWLRGQYPYAAESLTRFPELAGVVLRGEA
jgi:hypothetical protein